MEGKIPFLGATQYNNGITAFYSKETIMQYDKAGNLSKKDAHKRILKGNCLAITNDGSVGNVYYQKIDFVCSHSVTPIYLKHQELNPQIALFLIVVLQKSGESFGYAKKWRPKRMKDSKVLLPLDSEGKPNWAFMESCMSYTESRHLAKILTYYQQRVFQLQDQEAILANKQNQEI